MTHRERHRPLRAARLTVRRTAVARAGTRVWAALAIAALGGCAGLQAGSRSVTPELYTIHYTWKQLPSGAVTIDGETDLPNGSEIDALVIKSDSPDEAVDTAVLIGSTDDVPLSKPIRDRHFEISLQRVLSNSCGVQPPCGPFAPGPYHLLIDARTPDAAVANGGPSTYDDPRYLSKTHGIKGFTGIEIEQLLPLHGIRLCLDANGQQGEGNCGT